MEQHRALIETFYRAFQRRDAAAMAACYHRDIVFDDPAFRNLRGREAGAMWAMLCGRAQDLVVEFGGVEADARMGRARWEAWYTFSQTGRKVHNVIDAHFEFEDGKIVRHIDRFPFWRWSRQALGAPGWLLGWTPILQRKVQATVRKALDHYLRQNP